MTGSVIVLDLDGVLRGISKGEDRWLNPRNVEPLNWLLDESAAKIVVSSTWRGMVHSGHMDCHGLGYFLRSHGVRGDVIGCTREDLNEDDLRGYQIRDWLREHLSLAGRYVVLDDDDDGISDLGLRAVLVNPSVGLTRADAEKALKLLQ